MKEASLTSKLTKVRTLSNKIHSTHTALLAAMDVARVKFADLDYVDYAKGMKVTVC